MKQAAVPPTSGLPVDEEVRREQLKKLWERYGNYMIAAAFAVVLAVAAYRGYEWWQNKKAVESGEPAKIDA